MFIVIRIIIVLVFFISLMLAIKRVKATSKIVLYIMAIIFSLLMITGLSILPFENSFVSFNSPESAYDYADFGKSEVLLVVEGKNSDLVIGNNDGVHSYLIIPKNKEGWKIGRGIDVKKIAQKYFGEIRVCVYQHRPTDEYFITIADTNGGYLDLSDSNNSKFSKIEKKVDSIGKTMVTYYANIPELDSAYWINITQEGDKGTVLLSPFRNTGDG